jgi:aminoglycoside phosphotransferase (APT) family kinase protein
MPALLKAAATALHRHENDIKSVRKLDEGGFNRVFEVTMKDGFQLIARLPYPSTQPKSLVTASEVATMNLVRHHGVPTPKIYQYSSNACNPVGAEYILMEKIQGRCLGDMWFDLSDKDRVRLLGEIVDQEAKLFNIDFPAYGSVYLDADLPGDVGRTPMDATKYTENFCIGPDVSLKHWFQTRSKLDVSRSSGKLVNASNT